MTMTLAFPVVTEKRISMAISVLLHLLLFYSARHQIIEAARYGISLGGGPVEINLVAAPSQSETVFMNESDFIIERKKKKKKETTEIQPFSQATGTGAVTEQSVIGAFSDAKPNYLKNPPPEYPARARQLGQQGVVMLSVEVDCEGVVKALSVKKSSGFVLLDEAAVKSVRNWKFLPASSQGANVESKVEVPVRFKIENS